MGGGNRMSKIALEGNAAGTGTFTIASPNSNTSRTLTLPDATGTLVTGTQPAGDLVGTTATQTLTNKTINASQLVDASITAAKLNGAQSGSAPIYGARAWANFNGTGTPAIRASGNVSSIGDNGVGLYTVNFTTALPDADYSAVTSASEEGTTYTAITGPHTTTTLTASAYQFMVTNDAGARRDSLRTFIAVFR